MHIIARSNEEHTSIANPDMRPGFNKGSAVSVSLDKFLDGFSRIRQNRELFFALE